MKILTNILEKIIFSRESDQVSTKREALIIHPVLPHGKLEQLFEGVWFVRGQVKMPMAFPKVSISHSMTVIRDPKTKELTLVNAMRLDETELAELARLGTIKNTLRIAGFHGRDDIFYKDRFGATVYALEGQVYTREMMRPFPDPSQGYMQADIWLKPEDKPPVPNSRLWWFKSSSKPEAILVLDRDGGILVTGDSLQNTATADEYHNWVSKLMSKKMGFFKPYNVGPGWVQYNQPALEEIHAILELSFDHVLPGHGVPVIGNAKEKYRPAIEGEIKGCHAKGGT